MTMEGGVGKYLIIHWDYQKIIKQFRNLEKAKDFLASANTGPVESGWIKCNYRFSPLDGGLEQITFTLEGEGPFYFLDNRMLRMMENMYSDFKFPEVGDIIWIGDFRLKVIANHRGWPSIFLVMFPDILSVLIYGILPVVRWFDLIYRRLILTASVWNLARCRAEEWPHWGHLKWSKEYKKTKEVS